jgi:gamma-tubulin complex component 5
VWQQIFAEDPLEGEHWKMPDFGSDSDPDAWADELAPPQKHPLELALRLDRDILLPASDSASDSGDTTPSTPEPASGAEETDVSRRLREAYAHRKAVEDLQARQYWRPEWESGLQVRRRFDIGDASTLGPSTRRVLAEPAALKVAGPEHEVRRLMPLSLVADQPTWQKYIYEYDVYREVLMALQGRANLLIVKTLTADLDSLVDLFVPSPAAPRLAHLTLVSFHSILSSFAHTCSTAWRLRSFVDSVYTPLYTAGADHATASGSARVRTVAPSRTLEAFAEAVDAQLTALMRWCADREDALVSARTGGSGGDAGRPVIASLLSLQAALTSEHAEPLDALLDVLRELQFPLAGAVPRRAPAALACAVLDALHRAMHASRTHGHARAAHSLGRALVAAAEPIWALTRAWLRDGPVGAGTSDASGVHEFFVEDHELAVQDPDFWTDGLMLRTADTDGDGVVEKVLVPAFLRSLAPLVLAAGKAHALLRVLDPAAARDARVQGGVAAYQRWLRAWRPFHDIVSAHLDEAKELVSEDALAHLLMDELAVPCAEIQATLVTVVMDECELWHHLHAVEDLYLMRRGDVMSLFTDTLFARVSLRFW